MSTKEEQLYKRGYLEKDLEKKLLNLCTAEKLRLLQSNEPGERTMGARLLSKEEAPVTAALIRALKIENKLYPKIEICRALQMHHKESVASLVKELGKIGKNQHSVIPDKEFGKANYPLPRDIAARTLANIGKAALGQLFQVLQKNIVSQTSEAIDAIGFICFYDHQANVFEELEKCYLRYKPNDLIRWKIIRAMSGLAESAGFLKAEFEICENERIKTEINRSLQLIKKRKK